MSTIISKENNSHDSVEHQTAPGYRKKLGLSLWLAGFIGVLSLMTTLPKMMAVMADSEPEISIGVIQLISGFQSGLILLLAVWLGLRLGGRHGLLAPVFSRWATWPQTSSALAPVKSLAPVKYGEIILWGIAGGFAGGLVLAGFTHLFEPYMPADFLARAEQLAIPLYSKILYGGITEEILIRWGLMSFLVWLIAKLAGSGSNPAAPWVFVSAIIVTSLLFGAGHLPLANVLADTVTPAIKAYVFLANGFFGLIAGYLFWKKGLESAILAHMLAHIVWAVIG